MQTRAMTRSVSPVAHPDDDDPHEEHPQEEAPPRRSTRAAARAAALALTTNTRARAANVATATPRPTKPAPKKTATSRATKPTPAKKTPAKKTSSKKTPAKKTPARGRGRKPADDETVGHKPDDIIEVEPEQRHALVETESNAAGRSPHDNQSGHPYFPFSEFPSLSVFHVPSGPIHGVPFSPVRTVEAGSPARIDPDTPSGQIEEELQASMPGAFPSTAANSLEGTPTKSEVPYTAPESLVRPGDSTSPCLSTPESHHTAQSSCLTSSPTSPIGLASGAFDLTSPNPSSSASLPVTVASSDSVDYFSAFHTGPAPVFRSAARRNQQLISHLNETDRKRTYEAIMDDSTEPPSKRRQRLACLAAIDRLNSSPAPIPYHERRRRRKIEATGRLDKSIFRIPQLIRQQKREGIQRPESEPEAPATPVKQNPPPKPRGSGFLSPWGRLRNLLGGDSNSESTAISSPQEPVHITPISERDLTWSLWPARRTRSPPRRLSRTRSEDTDALTDGSQSPNKDAISPKKTSSNTTDAPTEPTLSLTKDAHLETTFPVTAPAPPSPTAPSSSVSSDAISADQPTAPGPSGQKRKRVIPAVIPNPPGSSYGMHPDYFWYSDDDEDEQPVERAKPKPTKRVRFDLSPETAPSKVKARAREQVRSPSRTYGFDYEAHSSDSEVEREQEKWEESLRVAQRAKKAAALKPAKKQVIAKPVSTSRVDNFKPRLPSGLRSQTGAADDAHGVPSFQFQWPMPAVLEGVPAVQPQDIFGGLLIAH